MRRVGISHIVEDGGGMRTRKDGQGTFGRGWSFGGEVMLLARSTGQCRSGPRRAELQVNGCPSCNNSCS